jgi:signal transduction histidine kinase
MTSEEHWLHQRESVFAWLRVGFSLIAAIILLFNPARGAGYPILSQFALYGFFIYSLITLYFLTRGRSTDLVGKLSTGLDLFWVTLIVFSTRGSNSPFFVYYLFPVITASTRYGIKGSLPVALIGVACYGYMRFSPIYDRPIAIDTYIIRSIYMLTLASIFGFLSDLERKQNKKLSLLYRTAAEAATQEERRRIARELHDRVLQVLASLRLRAEACRKHLMNRPDELKRELQSIEEAAGITITEIRRFLAKKDNPYDLMAGTLEQRLKEELGFLRDGMGMMVVFHSNLDGGGILQEAEQEVYYVLREGIVNVARHSRASELNLSLVQSGAELNVSLEDNGIGFGANSIDSGAGYGLTSMRERIEKIGGQFNIQSAPGKGTQISFKVPMSSELAGTEN